jgi:hypothetical protein
MSMPHRESPVRRKPYERPELTRVHVDPVRELLLATPCNPGPNRLCEPPVCTGGPR